MNQPPLFLDRDFWAEDTALREAVAANGVDGVRVGLPDFGRSCGSAELAEFARAANEVPPRLRRLDPRGEPLDTVDFHPAWHMLMDHGMAAGLHVPVGLPGAPAGGHVARAARLYLECQAEPGHVCPLTMTQASGAALGRQPDLLARLAPRLAGRTYDPGFLPWWEKDAVTIGMGMTERQGGTDVRRNETRAVPDGPAWRIDGEKWFMSAPMCDAFLVLAQAPDGLTCFFLPRFRPDGGVNGLRFERLKDKLGNRSNASSEVRFDACHAERVGPEGEGIPTILAMVQMTRLDCIVSSAGLMRLGLAMAVHHARHRSVFQRLLCDQPAMRPVLADLALEVEGATALALRLARAFDAPGDPEESAFARIVTPAAKMLVCKRAPDLLAECMEVMGGNGYVEDHGLARLYREAPVNAIWEGSGNVMALDVLRAVRKAPDAAARLLSRLAAEATPTGRAAAREAATLAGGGEAERHARRIALAIARLAAASALRRTQPALAAAYEETRFAAADGGIWGVAQLPEQDRLIARVLPG
jgi:putative acyl-CoA dehydrogenase